MCIITLTYMKKCCRCKKIKIESDFNFKVKSLKIRQKACKECTRIEVRKHYYIKTKYYIDKARHNNFLKSSKVKEFIWEYLISHPCVDCGESDPIVLEFDHIQPKKFNLSMRARERKMEDVIIEIRKCEIRCANCHRRKTSKQYGWDKKPL